MSWGIVICNGAIRSAGGGSLREFWQDQMLTLCPNSNNAKYS
jgi:hypothetical protein